MCHSTPTHNGSVCRSFVRQGHQPTTSNRRLGPKMEKVALTLFYTKGGGGKRAYTFFLMGRGHNYGEGVYMPPYCFF